MITVIDTNVQRSPDTQKLGAIHTIVLELMFNEASDSQSVQGAHILDLGTLKLYVTHLLLNEFIGQLPEQDL